MDKTEAGALLQHELEALRDRFGVGIVGNVGHSFQKEATGPSGSAYQIEIDVAWDDSQRTRVRLIGGIDDGGLSAFRPLTLSILIPVADGNAGGT